MVVDSTTPNASDKTEGKVPNKDEAKANAKSFEDLLIALGDPGWYAIIQIGLLLINIIPMAFVNTRFVFISFEPGFTCSQVNETDLYNDAGISTNEAHLHRTLYEETCDIQIQRNESETWKSVKSFSCSHGYDYKGGEDISFVTEWDLVCDKTGVPQLTQAFIAIGGFVGMIFVNSLADLFGRKTIILCSLILVGATELGTAFAPNIYVMVATCFCSGVVTSGLYVCTYVLAFELVKSRHRVAVSVIAGMIWALCIVILSGVAYAFRNAGWRRLQLCISIICWLPLVFMYFINESASWLHSIGNRKRAKNIIQQACKTNGVDFDGKIKEMFDELYQRNKKDENDESSIENPKSSNVLDLFKHKKLVMILSITCFACFANESTYNGLFLTSSTLVGSQYVNMAILALMGIPAGIMLYILHGLHGRKTVIIIFTLLTALALLISTCVEYAGIDEGAASKISLTFFVIGKFTNSAGYNALIMYIPESFPTTVRSTGSGIASSGSTVGGIVAAYLLPLKKIASWAPGAGLVACSLLAAALFVKLPETKGKHLVATVEAVKSETPRVAP